MNLGTLEIYIHYEDDHPIIINDCKVQYGHLTVTVAAMVGAFGRRGRLSPDTARMKVLPNHV